MCRLTLMIVALAFAILCSAAAPAADGPTSGTDAKRPSLSVQTSGNLTVVLAVDPDLSAQARMLAELRKVGAEQNPAVVQWLTANANEFQPAFLYELARRLWDMGRHPDAFEAYALAAVRADYDGRRCVDTTAWQGIAVLPQLAADVAKGIAAERPAFGAAGLRALTRADLFAGKASPWWICVHGMKAISAAMNRQALAVSDWLKPESEWRSLQDSLRQKYTKYFEEQGKPQNDPIAASKRTFKTVQLTAGDYNDFVWLDARQLLIGESVRGPGPPQTIVHSWRPDTGQAQFDRISGPWCAGNGIVSHRTKLERGTGSASKATFLSGPPGKLTETSIDFEGVAQYARLVHSSAFQRYGAGDPHRQSSFDCRWVKSERLSGPKRDRGWMPLREGDGFLSFSEPDGRAAEHILYYPSEESEPIRTRIATRNIQFHAVRYFSFRNAYFISPIAVPPKANETLSPCISVWWFDPQTRQADETCVPTDALHADTVTYAPSAIGLIRTVTFRRTPHGQMPGGLYLTSPDGRNEKIFEGNVRASAVSPDGCAVAIGSYGAAPQSSPVSIMELCQAGVSAEQRSEPTRK